MAMSTTAKLLTSIGLGVGSSILLNGVLRHQLDATYTEGADVGKANPWFRYAPFISAAGPAAVALLIWKLAGWGTDAALVALLSGLGASLAIPANDYVLTNLRKDPVTTIPMDVATGALRGVARVKQFAA